MYEELHTETFMMHIQTA